VLIPRQENRETRDAAAAETADWLAVPERLNSCTMLRPTPHEVESATNRKCNEGAAREALTKPAPAPVLACYRPNQPAAADRGGHPTQTSRLSARLIAAPAVANQFEPVHIAVHHAAVGSKVLQCHAARRETPFELSADFLS
jgi:hypothetical protein